MMRIYTYDRLALVTSDGLAGAIWGSTCFVIPAEGDVSEWKGITELEVTPEAKALAAHDLRREYPDIGQAPADVLHVLAWLEAPSLEEVRADALAAVKARHADMLRVLSGGYSVEERDTWPNQRGWVASVRDCGRLLGLIDGIAASLPEVADTVAPLQEDLRAERSASIQKLEGLLTDAEIARIEDAGGVPSDVMVQKITQKVAALDLLIQKAGRVRRTATEALVVAASIAEIDAVVARANRDAETASAQYLAAQSAG